MIRALVSVAPAALLLGGCTIPIDLPDSQTCHAETSIGYIGQRYNERIGRIIKDKAQATYVRPIRPDMMVTQEFRANRVNIALDDRDLVTRVYCG